MNEPYTGLAPHRHALEHQGVRVVGDDGEELIAVHSKWHWEVFLTKMTWIVAVTRVGQLTTERIRADRDGLTQKARDLDPSALPRGFQKGMVVLSLYVADSVDDDAAAMLRRKPEMRFAWFHVPGALDRSTGQLLGEVLQPPSVPGKEPLSKLSCGMCGCIVALMIGVFVLAIAAIVLSNI